MDGDEKLPTGWIKVQSRSRPEKAYYFNKALKLSLWKLEDLKKFSDSVSSKSEIPATPKKSPTKSVVIQIKKPATGISNQSKTIKKNVARERLSKLQDALAAEVKRGENKSSNTAAKKLEDFKDVTQVVKPAFAKSNGTKVTEKKNIALNRMSRLSHQLKDEVKSAQETKPSASSSFKTRSPESFTSQRKFLEVAVQNESNDVEMSDATVQDVNNQKPSTARPPDFCEPMDWEYVPEHEVINKVKKIREAETSTNPSLNPSQNSSYNLKASENDFHIIVDTNVLLSNVDFVSDIKGKYFKDIGKARIFLPYIVLCELDKLKMHQDIVFNNVSKLARRAIRFIDECFQHKDPFIHGQSAVESVQRQIIPIESGDDEILNCCLQFKETTKKIILLTNDANLRNKACVNNIEAFSRDILHFYDFNARNEIKFD